MLIKWLFLIVTGKPGGNRPSILALRLMVTSSHIASGYSHYVAVNILLDKVMFPCACSPHKAEKSMDNIQTHTDIDWMCSDFFSPFYLTTKQNYSSLPVHK